MPGGFVLVVGPSGAGKDTLIGLAQRALADDGRFVFPRRLITRPSSPWEDHDALDPSVFERAAAAGRFCLAWHAHGLSYAIPAEALAVARHGQVGILNVSRQVVEEARRRLPNVAVVEVTAPVQVLAQRLAIRARETDGEVRARLERSREIGEVRADLTIVNASTPEESAASLVSFLRDRFGTSTEDGRSASSILTRTT